MNYIKFIFSTMILAALLFSGCKKTDTTPTGPGTAAKVAAGNYTGVLQGSSASGIISLNIPSSSAALAKTEGAQTVVTVTGTVVVGSDSLNISGSYNTSNDSLTLSGTLSGKTFTFVGTYNTTTGALTGSWSDSNGDSGNFAATAGGSSSVKVYLGSAVSTAGHGTANLDICVSGNAILGVASLGSQQQVFTGAVSGDAITLSYNAPGIGLTTIGSGTFNSGHTSASGSYNLLTLDSGTWAVTVLN